MINLLRYVNVYVTYCEESTTMKTKTKGYINEINPEKVKKFLDATKSPILELFELQECIGSGSESIVYKAKKKKSECVVALKLIIKKKTIMNEINILKKLNNKNIIKYYDSKNINDELDYIEMEYGNYNLRDFQKKILKLKTFSETFLCYITYQILNGLKYCHFSCKVAHLDLKPQNIVIDDCLNVKLIDFSISIDYNKTNLDDKIKLPFRGTCFYIAPEVFTRKTINIKDYNKVDLYSLGVILYNLAFGCYPFGLTHEDNNYNVIFKKIINSNLTINEENNNFSSYFVDFLKLLLEKDINKRININEALNHYWVKGAKILFDEKELLCDSKLFLNSLFHDGFKNYNDYNKKK